jgi:hypothetical protein
MAQHVSSRKLRELLTGSISSVIVVFRNVLRLLGQRPPVARRDSGRKIAELTGLAAEPFLTILDIKEEIIPARRVDLKALVESYLAGIDTVTRLVDRLDKEQDEVLKRSLEQSPGGLSEQVPGEKGKR